MTHRITAVTGLALLVLVGCAPPENGPDAGQPTVHTIQAKVSLEKGEIYIHKEVHNEALVRPGDLVRWVCDCDPAIQFAVEEPAVLLNTENLTQDPWNDRWNREAIEELARRLQNASNREPQQTAEAGAEAVEHGAGDPITAARDFLQAIAPALPARSGPDAPPPKLFERAVPAGFVDADGAIESHPVRVEPGSRVWKFAWKFRLKKTPEVEEVWDPHLYS